MRRFRFWVSAPAALLATACLATPSYAQNLSLDDCLPLSPAAAQARLERHLFGGDPGGADPVARRAYVVSFDLENLVPSWVAWHAHVAYRTTPPRQGVWKSYGKDESLSSVVSADYVGWFADDLNLARGHLVPYFISGGDRNGNGRLAAVPNTTTVDDVDDACTVYEVNAMSNITPQFHNRFNGSGGIWNDLEVDIRALLDHGRDFQIIAGTVFLAEQEIARIGNRDEPEDDWPIGIPHGYFKIVIDPDTLAAVGFLFDHMADLEGGCDIDVVEHPSDCIVAIADIESVTGLTFFPELSERKNEFLRGESEYDTWLRWLTAID